VLRAELFQKCVFAEPQMRNMKLLLVLKTFFHHVVFDKYCGAFN